MKPWEETWEHISGAYPTQVFYKGGGSTVADVWAGANEDMNGTADLIAATPEMARLLLELEWTQGYEGGDCATCARYPSEGHAPDCCWLAVMRKAGVRE